MTGATAWLPACIHASRVLGGPRPAVRRPDGGRIRLAPRVHPRVAGPRLVVVVEDDPRGARAVDVCGETRRGVRNLGRAAGVEQAADVHVRGVEVPFREIDD